MTTAAPPLGDLRSDQEWLYCERGDHRWVRRKTRGTKPFSCPEHPKPPSQRFRKAPQAVVTQYDPSRQASKLDPVLREVSGATIAFHTQGDRACAAALRRLAAVAELLALELER